MGIRKAVLDRAKVTVEQWDKHDQFRQTEADKSLNDPQIGEPDEVAIARALLVAESHEASNPPTLVNDIVSRATELLESWPNDPCENCDESVGHVCEECYLLRMIADLRRALVQMVAERFESP